MKTKNILIPFALGVTAVACTTSKEKEQSQPNIVWLIAEDLSPDFSFYGVKGAQTPTLERMAKEGVCFQNAFAAASISSASRSGFVTGMYQTAIKGANCHRPLPENFQPLPAGCKTVFDLFHDAGYFVDYNGKKDLNFAPIGYGIKDRDLKDRKEGQPFFMVLQSKYTHRTFKGDKNNPIDPMTLDLPPHYPEHPLTRKDFGRYFEDIQLLDHWVSDQLAMLKEKGLLDNTIVVFFGDHGRPHVRDKQFLYEGGTKVPLIMQAFGRKMETVDAKKLVSLVDLAPTMLDLAGLKVPDFMQGQAIFSDQKEREYVAMARDRCGDAMDHIRAIRTKKYHFIKNEMPEVPWMQLSSYKKIQYPVYTLLKVLHAEGKLTPEQEYFMQDKKPVYELYDVEKDPHQLYNLAESKPEIVKEMNQKLEQWKKETNDVFYDPDEAAGQLEAVYASKAEWLKGWYKKNGFEKEPTDLELLDYWMKKYEL